MALTAYLKLPDIAGESMRAEHEEEIDIHAMQWEIAQGAAAQVGRGRSQSRAQISGITMNKFVDAATPYLQLASMQGKSLDECVLAVRKDSGEAHLDYLVITMTNAVVSSYEMLETSDEGLVIEEKITLTFEKVKVVYTVQADDHSAGDEHEIEYDIAAGV